MDGSLGVKNIAWKAFLHKRTYKVREAFTLIGRPNSKSFEEEEKEVEEEEEEEEYEEEEEEEEEEETYFVYVKARVPKPKLYELDTCVYVFVC